MRRITLALTALAGLLLPAAADARAAGAPARLDPAVLAARIDEHVAARWKERGVTPAGPADDAELVRRVYLDLAGRIPDILAARDFIDDRSADKRERLIDDLLGGDRYAVHWANVWRAWLLPDTVEQPYAYLAPAFEVWLRDQIKANPPYDRLVRSLVANTAAPSGAGNPYIFYQAYQNRPENLAAATSRLFLGVKLECAQCHNHPSAKWKRQQFWELAAFFAGTVQPIEFFTRSGRGRPPSVPTGAIKIPGTDKVARARFLDGKEAKWSGDPRAALVDWMVAKDNPFFARARANCLWEHLLGLGLVEPVDEEAPDNPPSHPALLDLLAQQFTAHDYDLKYLIKAIMLSRTYQQASRQTHSSQADARLFARRKVRGLTPEQLYDSLALATGQKEEPPHTVMSTRAVYNPNTPRADFLRRFPTPDKRTEQQTSILQALYLMNGKIVADATSLEHNRNLAIIAEATSVRTSRRVEQLFLIALARKPTPAESARLVKYVDRGGPTGDPAQALCDVFWALLNSSEFCVNH